MNLTRLFLLIFTTLLFVSCDQTNKNAEIDKIFSEWDKEDSPGCALGVIQDRKLIYARGYGMANLEYNIPNSPISVFRIASTSKQFTAACIVLLAEQGKLSLSDNLAMFFPDFPDYAKKITLRHLLNHTSGIRDYLTISYLAGLSEDDYYTDEDIKTWLVNQKDNNFEPGEEFLYSNSGYWLLGQIVAEVSGESLANFARENIFLPLEMNNTHYHNDHKHIVNNRASGYSPENNGNYSISMTTLDMIGDGGIFTTIEDIKKWDDNFYKQEVGSSDFVKTMLTRGILNNGDTLDYALGLGHGEYKGLKTISHGGAFVGFRADIIRFPDEQLSVVIFANRSDANPTEMAYRVADVFLKDRYSDRPDEENEVFIDATPTTISLRNEELEIFCGTYWNSRSFYSRKIHLENDTLWYFRTENNKNALVPISDNEFQMIGIQGNIRLQFDVNENNERILLFKNEDQDPVISVFYETVSYSHDKLKAYSGSYYSSELNVVYDLKMQENKLVLYVKGREFFVLKPVMENLFSIENSGSFQFKKNLEGNIEEFRLAAGRVKNLLFVRQ